MLFNRQNSTTSGATPEDQLAVTAVTVRGPLGFMSGGG